MGLIMQGQIPTLTVGGRLFTDLTNLKILVASVASNNYATFRNLAGGASAGYAVTALKTLKIYAQQLVAQAASTQAILGYGDTDVGFSSAAGPTNPVYVGASAGTPNEFYEATSGFKEKSTYFEVPAGKYPHTYMPGVVGVTRIYGYEV